MSSSTLTWGEGGALYLSQYSALYHSPTTQQGHRALVDRVAEIVGSKALDDIAPEDIERYLATRKAAGRSPWTINDELVKIRSILKWLRQRKHVRRNVARIVHRLRVGDPKDPYAPELQEARKLIAYLGERRQTRQLRIVVLVINLGLRLREILRLRAEDVDLEKQLVSVRNIKTDRVDYLGLNPIAMEILVALLSERRTGLLLPSKSGQELLRWNVSKRFRQLAKRAGCPRVTFHNLRKFYSTVNAQIVTEQVWVRLMRHRDPRVAHAHYLKLHPPTPTEIR